MDSGLAGGRHERRHTSWHRDLGGRWMCARPWQRLAIMALPLWTILLVNLVAYETQTLYAQSGTPVSGAILTDTTWTLANSPYHVQANVVVESNVTLTIEPGVEVRVDANQPLNVEGTLLAQGTAEQPIRFTRAQEDGAAWQGIGFVGTEDAPAHGELQNVIVEYGGAGTAQGANIVLFTYAHVQVRDSIIRHSSNHGIYGGTNGSVELRAVHLEENANFAVMLRDFVRDPILAGLSASGNGADAVSIDSLGSDATLLWENSGLPYVVDASLQVGSGQSLTVEPGVEARFGANHRFDIAGELLASGTSEQPILFTGVQKSAGAWQGVHFGGTADDPASGELLYLIVEYGGAGTVQSANVAIPSFAHVAIHNSIIRHSGNHGIFVGPAVASIVADSGQIYDNAGDGIHNFNTQQAVYAPDNWWGDATGPVAPDGCNAGGMGESVSNGVLYLPFRTEAESTAQEMPTVHARLVSLAPQRWYAPLGFPTFVEVTVTDENGWPVSGEMVRLIASGGASTNVRIEDGAQTDAEGKTFAVVTGRTVGELTLMGELGGENCQGARSAATRITIVNAAVDGLMRNAKAPYVSNDLQADPMPIMRGISTTIRATLVNPNDFAITVQGQFRFAQLGIGLTFGPLDSFSDLEIPPFGEVTVEVPWIPLVTGHYCVRLDYSFTPSNGVGIAQTYRAQRNFEIAPAPFVNRNGKNAAQRAKVATDAIGDGQFVVTAIDSPSSLPGSFIQDQLFGNILDFIYEAGGGIACALGGDSSCSGWNGPRLKLPGDTISNLQKDPPRQDYQVIAPLDTLLFTPLEVGGGMSQKRVDALNELMKASLALAPHLMATVVTYDRYAGATEANNDKWASIQASHYDYYLYLSANLMLRVARAYAQLHQALLDEGVSDLYVTADDYRAYQARLRDQGFNAVEVEAAHSAGLNDEDLEKIRQRRIALDPETQAGSYLAHLLEMARAYGQAGNLILGTPKFTKGGRAGAAFTSEERPQHNLVFVNAQRFEVQIGNPTAAAATVNIETRPVDLPPDWSVVVSPSQVLLEPGQVITAEVTVQPGLAAVQGENHTFAVEGFIGDELIGGVALEVYTPEWVDLDALWSIFLPRLGRIE